MENVNHENNVDLAIKELRVLQQMFFKHDVTDMDLFNHTNKIIGVMENARKDVNTNFEEVSQKLTDFMNGKRSNQKK